MQYLPYLTNLLQLVTAVLALVSYNKYKYSAEKYFLPFLWFTFIFDFSCGILADYYPIDNYWIYNLYTGVSILFYFYWYYFILKNQLNKRLTLLFSFIFIMVFIVNFIFNAFNKLLDYGFVTGAIFIVILTGFYLYQLANSNDVLSIRYKLSFWIALALILFYVGMVPFMLLSRYFNVWREGNTFFIILLCLNIILYGCYSIGFLWTKKKYNHF